MDAEGEERSRLAGTEGNWERAERTSTYVIRFAPLRRNCLNSPLSRIIHTCASTVNGGHRGEIKYRKREDN